MRIDGATAVLAGPTLRVRMARDQQAEIEAFVSTAAGRAVTVELTEADAPAAQTTPAASEPVATENGQSGSVTTTQEQTCGDEPTAPPPTPDEEAQHPLVRLAAEQFGARVTGVHPKRHD